MLRDANMHLVLLSVEPSPRRKQPRCIFDSFCMRYGSGLLVVSMQKEIAKPVTTDLEHVAMAIHRHDCEAPLI
jgi:hypothetical protein